MRGVRTLSFSVSADGYRTQKKISLLAHLSKGPQVFENDRNKQRENGVVKAAI